MFSRHDPALNDASTGVNGLEEPMEPIEDHEAISEGTHI
jgi:hypothetical protein